MSALSPRAVVLLRWLAGIIVAIGVATLLWSYANRDNLISGCLRNSARSAAGAAGWERLADRVGKRNNPGDKESAERYKATSVAFVQTIPRKGSHNVYDATLIESHFVSASRSSDHLPHIVFSSRAKKAWTDGCDEAYPPLIPFVR